MTAQEIVEPLINKGFSLWVEEGNLRFKPKPDEATIENLRQHKTEIISFLSGGKQPSSQESPVKIPEGVNPASIDGNLPPSDQAEYRTERAAIMEHDGGLSEDEAAARASMAYPCICGGRRFWVSVHGPIICGACHPPAKTGLVARWIELKGGSEK